MRKTRLTAVLLSLALAVMLCPALAFAVDDALLATGVQAQDDDFVAGSVELIPQDDESYFFDDGTFAIDVYVDADDVSDDRLVLSHSVAIWEDGEAKQELTEGQEYTYEDDVITLDGPALREAGAKNVRVLVELRYDGSLIASDERYIEVRESCIVYDKESNLEMLPGSDGSISGENRVHIQNTEYPYGEDLSYEVVNVEVVAGEELLAAFGSSDDEGEKSWYYYLGDELGTVTFKVTYSDLEGNEQYYTFDTSIVEEIYRMEISNAAGGWRWNIALPGKSITLHADAFHETTDGAIELIDPRYDWKLTGNWEGYATIAQDPNDPATAIVTFAPLPEGETEFWMEYGVEVALYDASEIGGEQVKRAESTTNVTVSDNYTETVFTDDWDTAIEVGESQNVSAEVRSYSVDLPGEGYEVLDGVQFYWEDLDSEYVKVLDADGVEVNSGDVYTGGIATYTVERLSAEEMPEIRLVAEWGDGNWSAGPYWLAELEPLEAKDINDCDFEFVGDWYAKEGMDGKWSLAFAKGSNAGVTPEFVLYDDGEIVDPSEYTVTYERYWWDEDDYMTEVVEPPLTPCEGGYNIIIEANEDGSYEGTYNSDECPSVQVVDEYCLATQFTDMFFTETAGVIQDRINGMNANYYIVPQTNAAAFLGSLQVGTGAGFDAEQNEHDGIPLVKGTDYEVTYYKADPAERVQNPSPATEAIVGDALDGMPTTAGSYVVKVEGVKDVNGTGNYYGANGILIDIQDQMENVEVEAIGDQFYTGEAIEPELVVTYNGEELVDGEDYQVEYKNNTAIGKAQAVITGVNPILSWTFVPGEGVSMEPLGADRFFAGSKTVEFNITEKVDKKLEDCLFQYAGSRYAVAKNDDGWALIFVHGKNDTVTPEIALYDGGKLIDSSKYTVSYKKTWWDENDEMSQDAVAPLDSQCPDGSSQASYQIIVTAKAGSGYTGTFTMGDNRYPEIEIVDAYGLENPYADMYFDDIAGVIHDRINGMNSHYYVVPVSSAAEFMNSLKVRTGAVFDADVNNHEGDLLAKGADYKVAFYKADPAKRVQNPSPATVAIVGDELDSMPTTAGSYVIKVEGMKDVNGTGNYYGSNGILIDIQDSMANVTVAAIPNQKYTGKALTPKPKVTYNGQTLVEGKDYKVTYSGNKAVPGNEASVTITGLNPFTKWTFIPGEGVSMQPQDFDRFFTGSKTVKFKIVKASSTIKLAAQAKTYTGKALAYSGKVTKTGSTGKVTYKYYSDAKCTKAVKTVKDAGVYYVKATVAADAKYAAATSAAVKFTVNKAKGVLAVKAVKATQQASAAKATTIAAKNAFKVTKNPGKGKVTYKKVSGDAKIVVAKDGKITVKKGLKKGKTYTVKVKASVPATKNYKAANVTITFKIAVK